MSGKREDILRAAESLFASRGYEGVSVADLARAAGTAKSTVLHHFSSKHALYLKINQEPFQELRRMARTVTREAGDEMERVLGFFDGFASWVRSKPDYARLLLRLQIDDVERSRLGAERHWEQVQAPVLRALEDGCRNSTLAPTPGRMFVINLCNLILHFYATLDLERHLVVEAARADQAGDDFQIFIREHIRRALRPLSPLSP